ncbi:NADPH-dependent 2,4-dienoyl-CoA reductase, sulfur reductase [Bifidobacterium bohemicum]|uniref:NADH oxidoreductase n=1 Tax=Bifidobacterium bohemicum DSM 22767 TaxID=1437606 RepID=A0A086ZGL0_9BIFI|nr:FAD-dependent oxidoreductase [Bifidobacterium bohemicum]KFI45660.1 NADH oxidoreductase [Bifidobacterium bohemicum DSM 22767]SCB99317.1 NADPH-dependent 2,4-dienoyl-CoA reductase, sulfur reductase [Bifidobacterium bohemicum]
MTTVAVIGCTHAGTFAIKSILEQHPDWQVEVFERNDTISFLSCGIALWVGEHVSDPKRMFYSSPEELTEAGAHMHMRHEVTNVDIKRMTLTAKDLTNGTERRHGFDKLVITTGSVPAKPSIQGLDELMASGHVMLCKDYEDGKRIVDRSKRIKSVIVVGGGYIGSELAEQFSTRGIKTTLVDALPHVLDHNYDSVVTDAANKAFEEHDVTLAMGQKVIAFRSATGSDGVEDSGVTVVTELGEYTADFAIMGVGLVPNTRLVSSQLNTLGYGAIIVDEYMRASNPEGEILENVFAAGDCATTRFNPTGTNEYQPFATNAIHQAGLIGANIEHPTVAYMGTQATSAVQLYDLSMASTGMTLDLALRRHKDVTATTIEEDYRPDFMLSTTPVRATLVWEKGSGRILGAQFASRHDISMAANAVSIAIQAGFTIDQLAGTDMLFQPNFDQPINFINSLAMAAVSERNGQ